MLWSLYATIREWWLSYYLLWCDTTFPSDGTTFQLKNWDSKRYKLDYIWEALKSLKVLLLRGQILLKDESRFSEIYTLHRVMTINHRNLSFIQHHHSLVIHCTLDTENLCERSKKTDEMIKIIVLRIRRFEKKKKKYANWSGELIAHKSWVLINFNWYSDVVLQS